jgi:hypothetical protein
MSGDAMTDEWIAEMVATAGCLGQSFVGVPEDEMMTALYRLEADFENGLQQLGADAASTIAESFIATIIRVRREIEAAGDATPVVLN